MTKNNVLFASAGRGAELGQSFQHAIRYHFPAARGFTVDLNPDYSAACNISYHYFQVPRVDLSKKDFVAPNELGWQTFCIKSPGNNVHSQNLKNLENKYHPAHWLQNITDLKRFLF